MPKKKPQAAPVVKKIKVYPFEGQLDVAGGKKPLEVLFLNRDGIIARLDVMFVHVGEHYKIQFELPFVGRNVYTEVRVMKTYDRAMDPTGKKVERMAEFRFEKLTDDHRTYVASFLSTTGQNK